MDLLGNSKHYKGIVMYPAKLLIQFKFDILGMREDSLKCLKRIIALALVEHFFNLEIPDNAIKVLTSSIFRRSQNSDLIKCNGDPSRLSNIVTLKYVVGSQIFRSKVFERGNVSVHHLIPMISTLGDVVTISYKMDIDIQPYSHEFIPRMLELGYVVLETETLNIIGAKTCDRTLEIVRKTSRWNLNTILNQLKLEFNILSSQSHREKLQFTPSQLENSLSQPSVIDKVLSKLS